MSKRPGPSTKKRKGDPPSAMASPASTAPGHPASLPSYDPSSQHSPALARSTSSKQAPLTLLPQLAPTGPPIQIPGIPGAFLQQLGIPKKSTIKARKEMLQAQLPLRPGRAIVVRQSKKTLPGEGPGDWILGRIISSIQGDKNRSVHSAFLSFCFGISATHLRVTTAATPSKMSTTTQTIQLQKEGEPFSSSFSSRPHRVVDDPHLHLPSRTVNGIRP